MVGPYAVKAVSLVRLTSERYTIWCKVLIAHSEGPRRGATGDESLASQSHFCQRSYVFCGTAILVVRVSHRELSHLDGAAKIRVFNDEDPDFCFLDDYAILSSTI